jgi:hypothetical protein
MRAALTPFSALTKGGNDGDGSWVSELGLGSNDSQAAYAIYDVDKSSKAGTTPARLVLINYADGATTFNIPAPRSNVSQNWKDLSVMYLSGPSLDFSYDGNPGQGNVTWGGRTVVNGTWTLLDSEEDWVGYNQSMSCDSGCQVTLPKAGVAVAFVGEKFPSDQTDKKPAVHNQHGSSLKATAFSLLSLGLIVSWTVIVNLL